MTSIQCNCSQEDVITRSEFSQMVNNVDQFFLLVNGCIIWFMACGFAYLELGITQAKNVVNVLVRNMFDQTLGILAYWLWGYAFAYGDGNAFIGLSNFGLSGLPRDRFAFWFFQWTFASTAPSIVAGAVSERIGCVASMIQSIVISSFTYTVVSHWIWADEGWLKVGIKPVIGGTPTPVSFIDFAGSTVVHVTGGASALVTAYLTGPRKERIQENTRELKPPPPAHSIPLMALGAMILIFGFLAFNGASNLTIAKNASDGAQVGQAIANTAIAFASAALGGFLASRIFVDSKTWHCSRVINAALCGQVAICSSCNAVEPWGAFCIGFIAAFVYIGYAILTPKVGIDDPLEAVAVHFGGGTWGCMAAVLFNNQNGFFRSYNSSSGYAILWQATGLVAVVLWSAGISSLVFIAMRYFDILRPPLEWETKGLDEPMHGEHGYPPEAFECGWLKENLALTETMMEAHDKFPISHIDLSNIRHRYQASHKNPGFDPDNDLPPAPVYSHTTNV